MKATVMEDEDEDEEEEDEHKKDRRKRLTKSQLYKAYSGRGPIRMFSDLIHEAWLPLFVCFQKI